MCVVCFGGVVVVFYFVDVVVEGDVDYEWYLDFVVSVVVEFGYVVDYLFEGG